MKCDITVLKGKASAPTTSGIDNFEPFREVDVNIVRLNNNKEDTFKDVEETQCEASPVKKRIPLASSPIDSPSIQVELIASSLGTICKAQPSLGLPQHWTNSS